MAVRLYVAFHAPALKLGVPRGTARLIVAPSAKRNMKQIDVIP